MAGPNIIALRRIATGRSAEDDLDEDEIEMPGGARRSIDDVRSQYGDVPEALMRKARPETYASMHGGMSPAQVDQIERTGRMPRPARDWMAGAPATTMDEDEVELPGGGQASMDDLEMIGGLTPALEAKARPDVREARAAMGETGRARERFAGMLAATEPRVAAQRRSDGDASRMERIIRDELVDASPSMVAEYMQWYRRDPEQFGREFYQFAADRRERLARAQQEVDTRRQVEATQPRTFTITRGGR